MMLVDKMLPVISIGLYLGVTNSGPYTTEAFVNTHVTTITTTPSFYRSSNDMMKTTKTKSSLNLYQDGDYVGGVGGGSESPFFLSAKDIERLSSLRSRQVSSLPIMILDPIIPGQSVTVQSNDPIFTKLITYCQQQQQQQKEHNNNSEVTTSNTFVTSSKVGIIGNHPTTGNPLCHGVMADMEILLSKAPPGLTNTIVKLTGKSRMQIQGEAWEEDGHLSVADCEILDGRYEPMTTEQFDDCTVLADRLDRLLDIWNGILLTMQDDDDDDDDIELDNNNEFDDDYKPKPNQFHSIEKYWTELSLYATSLLNPVNSETASLTKTTTSIDIRPAMLTAATPYQRLLLAVTALQSTIAEIS